jgi:hypothetical protein
VYQELPSGDQPAARRSRLASPATATALGALVLVLLGRDDLASTVHLTLEPAHLSLWVSHRD